MKLRILLSVLVPVGLAACGGSDSGTDVGSGTHTLTVQASASRNEDAESADLHAHVERAGSPVVDAIVTIHSQFGDVVLTHEGAGGDYFGAQAGWASNYALDVTAGTDHLDASIAAPQMMTLEAPDTTVAIDAHAVADGVLHLSWSGDWADSIRVKSKDFEYEGADEGHVDMPVTFLKESSQELELRRQNSIALAGGVAGSTFTASCRSNFTLLVVNPY